MPVNLKPSPDERGRAAEICKGETVMNENLKENLTRRGIWLRLCFMIILGMAFSLAQMIIFAVVAFQFFSSLFTGETNDRLTRLGRNLARYLQQITVFLTFGTEEIPFPFAPWPDEPHEPAPVKEEPPEATPHLEAPREEAPVEEESTRENDKPESAGSAAGKDEARDAKAAEAPRTAVFADGSAYDKFMGERSRRGGELFVKLLGLPSRLSWLDVGCGTGAFSAVILENCDPSALIGIDRSEPQIAHARTGLGDARASFRVGDANALPFEVDSFDVAVSSYVLNFVPDKQKMMDEMARVVRPEGTVAVSVFDHAGGRQASHPVWELIGKKDAAFHKAEFEKRGWNITHPEALSAFFEAAGLEDVTVNSIDIDETFANFDEYWNAMTSMPTSGMSSYIDTLDQEERDRFKDELKSLLPIEPDGSIRLVSGSWVVRGKVPA